MGIIRGVKKMEVKNDLSKKVQQKVYTFNDNYWLFFEGEEYKN